MGFFSIFDPHSLLFLPCSSTITFSIFFQVSSCGIQNLNHQITMQSLLSTMASKPIDLNNEVNLGNLPSISISSLSLKKNQSNSSYLIVLTKTGMLQLISQVIYWFKLVILASICTRYRFYEFQTIWVIKISSSCSYKSNEHLLLCVSVCVCFKFHSLPCFQKVEK